MFVSKLLFIKLLNLCFIIVKSTDLYAVPVARLKNIDNEQMKAVSPVSLVVHVNA